MTVMEIDVTMVSVLGESLVLNPVSDGARQKSPIRIACIAGEDDVVAVLGLLPPDSLSSAFQHTVWLERWFATIGKAADATPYLMLATCQNTGAFRFALPLVRWKRGGIVRLDAVDLGLADYVAPIVAADFSPSRLEMNQLWQRMLAQLPAADLLYLGKIPAEIAGHANPLVLVDSLHRHRQKAWGAYLGQPPLDFTALGMPKKRSRELNNRWKRLAGMGELTFRHMETAAEKDAAFATLVAQRSQRFAALGRPNSLEKPEVRAFYRNLLDAYDGRNGAVLQTLTIDGEIIAAGLGLVTPEAFLMIFPTIGRDEWKPYSPGLQHFRKSMEWACDRGRAFYDFTLGSEAYKSDFGARPMDLFEIVEPLSVKGRAVAAKLAVERFVHQRPKLVQFLRRLRKPFATGGK